MLNLKAFGDPKNPSIIFLHGFLGSNEDFLEIVHSFSKDYHCVLVDLPFHGASLPLLSKNPFKEMDLQIIKLLNHFNKKNCSIIGYSLGGRLALHFKTHFPKMITKLVLLGSHPGLNTIEEREQRERIDTTWIKKLTQVSVDIFLEDWYSNPIFSSLKKRQTKYKEMLKKRKQNNPSYLAKTLEQFSLAYQPSLWKAAKSPSTLFLVGGEDRKFLDLYKNLPKERVEIIPNSTHALLLENPKEVISKSKNFLNMLEPL